MTTPSDRMVDHVVFNMLRHGIGNLSETRQLLHDAVQGLTYAAYDEATVHSRIDRRRMLARARIVETTGMDVRFLKSSIEGDLLLADGVKWEAGLIEIKDQMLPDTVLQAIIGEPVTRLVAHTALSDDMIIEKAERAGPTGLRITVSNVVIDPGTMKADIADVIEHRRRLMKARLLSIPAYFADYAKVAIKRDEPRWDWGNFMIGLPLVLPLLGFFTVATAALIGHSILANLAATGTSLAIAAVLFLFVDLVLNHPSVSVHYMPKRKDRLKRAREAIGSPRRSVI